MNLLKKFGVYLIMFIPAALMAGIYGALHDQISYSISSEYFTHFKFIQFSMPWAQETPRAGAALVGALATWWFGVLIFIVLGLFGFIFNSPKQMAVELVKSFGIVFTVALLTGIAGLMFSYFHVNDSTISTYSQWLAPGVEDSIQFVRVGFMHNASYLGGLTGLIAGVVYLFLSKKRYNKMRKVDARGGAL